MEDQLAIHSRTTKTSIDATENTNQVNIKYPNNIQNVVHHYQLLNYDFISVTEHNSRYTAEDKNTIFQSNLMKSEQSAEC